MKTRLFLVDYQVYFSLHGNTDKINPCSTSFDFRLQSYFMSKTQKYKIKTQFRMLKKFKEQRAAVRFLKL